MQSQNSLENFRTTIRRKFCHSAITFVCPLYRIFTAKISEVHIVSYRVTTV